MSKSVDDVDDLTTMFADIDPTLFDEICPSDDKVRSARVKFTDFQDYLRTMGRGAQRLEEETMKEEKAPIDSCSIKLLRLGDNNNNEYNAIFRTPAGYRGKLEPGDRAVAYLKIEETQDSNIEETNGGPWDMRMIEPPAYARRGEITAVLARRWNEDHDKWFDERELPTITPPSDRKGGAELGYILKQRGIEARIEPVDRHSLWVYIKKAYFQLHTLSLSTRLSPMEQSVLDFLVGDFTSLKAFNIYDTLMNKSLASETCMELNDSQKEAIHMGTKAPGGFVAITPFLKDSACDHHLLLTAATNRGVDSMACELHERLKNLSNNDTLLKNRYILRVHSVKTEKDILMRYAAKSRRRKLGQKIPKSAQGAGSSSSQNRGPESSISAHCSTFSVCKFELVNDQRVQNINLSIGQKALELIGLHHGGQPSTTNQNLPQCAKDFVRLYNSYGLGEVFSKEDEEYLDGVLDQVLGWTIQGATTLCATVGGAADDTVSTNFSDAELIVMDEASRMPEHEVWTLLAFYPKAIGKIMVGDPDQLGPYVKEYVNVKPYLPQLSMSLQERAQLAEFPSAFFTLQYRAVPQIAALYNRACYLNQLVDHETTFLDNGKCLLARQVVAHNNDKYGISASVIFYETKVAKEMQAYQKSKVCEQYATLAMKILENLLVAGFGGVEKPCTIAILTPYSGQYNVLCVAKEKMAKRYPEAGKVLVEMVGKSQGIEYDIVIADPVIASARRCFLTKNRLNVLFSRARQGLYVVGSHAKWSAMEKDHAPHLQAFMKELGQYRITWTPGNALRSEFIDPLDFVSSYDSD
ncbi:hypothetical protein LTR93_003572 [Exophiala xenobiotica]|nr:hypothetical protein LTR93_003572 [Exophiala xenobiotica]KAK5407929.1 hypothetical protein LTR06_007672 [Exophiala xenobiotica]